MADWTSYIDSNTRSCSAAGMPMPLSLTVTRTSPPTSATMTWIVPLSGVNRIELTSRLFRAWLSARASPNTRSSLSLGNMSYISSCLRRRAMVPRSRTTRSTTLLTRSSRASTGTFFRSTSIMLMRSWETLVMRFMLLRTPSMSEARSAAWASGAAASCSSSSTWADSTVRGVSSSWAATAMKSDFFSSRRLTSS